MKKLLSLLLFLLIFFELFGSQPFIYLENGSKIEFSRSEKITETGWPIVMSKKTELRLNGFLGLKIDLENISKLEITLGKFPLSIVETDCKNELCHLKLKLDRGTDPFEISEKIRLASSVKWVQPDWKRKVAFRSYPNDPLFPDQWFLPMIEAPEAWDQTKGEAFSIIGVLDSGVSIEHPDLAINIIKGKSFAETSSSVEPDPDVSGYNNNAIAAHGTCVAGVAAAITDNGTGVAGICPDCLIMPIKFFNYDEQSISVSRTLEAFKWMTDHDASVINNSWGEVDVDEAGNCIDVVLDNYRSDAINYASENGRNGLGTVVVWAAGNSKCDTAVNRNYDNPAIFLVGSVEKTGMMSNYSNWGDRIDSALPAASLTTDIPGKNGFNDSFLSGLQNLDYTDDFIGTSASAAVASGIAGLIISANPLLTASQVMNCMKKASTIPDISCPKGDSSRTPLVSDPDQDHSRCYGFGLIDTAKAVKMARNGDCGPSYNGCADTKCPDHFICDENSGKCIENEENPLSRYSDPESSGCSAVVIDI